MPIANYQQYCNMLDSAKEKKFAFAAINVTSTSTINAALEAFAQAKSDGIIQVSTGGGAFASGQSLKDEALGAISLAQHCHLMAQKYDILIALHTDHCQPKKVNSFLIPLIEETEKRRSNGETNLFNSHMLDASELPFEENMKLSQELLSRCAKSEIILEVETGVVGGEEDGVSNEDVPDEKLYTSTEEMVKVSELLSPIGRYMYAATFGNVHGVYKPGNVVLKPSILRDGQAAVAQKFGEQKTHDLVFHGGSGSTLEEIRETLNYGVIKMNIDTDTQYAYSKAVVEHMFKRYDEMLKIDGEVGNKKAYDPRAWMKLAENSMKDRIISACKDLRSFGNSVYQS